MHWPIQAHSCPGQGKKGEHGHGIILKDRSQEILVCCKDSWQLEQAAGGCKHFPKEPTENIDMETT